MRKRVSRPPRFVALDNGAVDTLRSMTAKGLLATLIRAKDGDDVTVEALCKTHTEGREMLTKAMRALVDDAFVVKFKIQRDKTQVVGLEDGRQETKRGGSWYTTFTVDSIPFTLDDVTAMLEEIHNLGNVKAVRVEPAYLDPRKTSTLPATGKPSVGATCGGTKKPQAGPTDGKPTVGRPTVGRSAAKKIKTGGEKDSLSDARDLRDTTDEREAAALKGDPPAGAGDVPGPREDTDSSKEAELTAEAVAMLVGLPGTVAEAAALRLVPLVLAALTAGWTLPGLRAHLAKLCDPQKVRYAPAVYEKHLKELPAAPRGSVAGAGRPAAPEGMCVRHPAFREGDCSPCRRAEMNRLDRGNSEPGPVDGMGLLARLQAARVAESAGAAGGVQ